MKPIDMAYLHSLEAKAREIGHQIGGAVGKGNGFALLLFSFDGPEMTWISNANRDDMIKVLDEFKAALKAGEADSLSRPKGRG